MTSGKPEFGIRNSECCRATTSFGMRLVALSLCCLFLLQSCVNKKSEIQEAEQKMQPGVDRAEGVTIYYSSKAIVKARLFSNEFVRNEAGRPPYVDMNKGLQMDFFNDSAVQTSKLTARYARYYEQQNNILIRDSVVVINSKGERLDTEELVWNQKSGRFFTDKFVRISSPTQVLFGDGMEANQDFTWYRIRNLKGMVRVNKSEVPANE